LSPGNKSLFPVSSWQLPYPLKYNFFISSRLRWKKVDFEYRILDFDYCILDFDYRILDFDYRILDFEYHTLDFKYCILDFDYRSKNIRLRIEYFNSYFVCNGTP
jgi:hypothetical protein